MDYSGDDFYGDDVTSGFVEDPRVEAMRKAQDIARKAARAARAEAAQAPRTAEDGMMAEATSAWLEDVERFAALGA